MLELQSRIHSQVQQEVDKSQREFFLREQMKAIQKELGESDSFTRDLGELREKLDSLTLPEPVREKAERGAAPPLGHAAGLAGGGDHPHLPGLADHPALERADRG